MTDDPDVRGPRLMHGAGVGLGLALLNVGVIAFGLGIISRSAEVAPLVMVYGGVPGGGLGVVLGVVAAVLARRRPWLRRVALGVPAFLLVWGLARAFELRPYAELAAVPTLVAVLLLERATRRRPWRPLAPARVAS